MSGIPQKNLFEFSLLLSTGWVSEKSYLKGGLEIIKSNFSKLPSGFVNPGSVSVSVFMIFLREEASLFNIKFNLNNFVPF